MKDSKIMANKQTKIQIEPERDFSYDTESLMSLGTGIRYEDPHFHLNLVHKKELPSDRPIIHTTMCQRLSFYRAFTSSPAKTDIIITEKQGLNSFLWLYALNVFFKSLPHSFVHFFLAAYAPEEHMFVAKMVPFCHGIKYLFVAVGFLEIMTFMDFLVFLFHYTTSGIIAKNPWNRCLAKTYFDTIRNVTVRCYEIAEFASLFTNTTHEKHGYFYVHQDTGEHFQVSQLEYYRLQHERLAVSWDISIFIFLWVMVQVLQLYAWKKSFWTVLNYTQWGINFVDFTTFLYLLVTYYDSLNLPPVKERLRTLSSTDDSGTISLLASNLEMLAESITAPPVVHILTSRSTQEIDPTTDSAVMIISNALIYIFRGLLNVRIHVHCERKLNTAARPLHFNERSWFYLWPIFWHGFYLGDIFSVLYTVSSLVCEMFIVVVTYQCTIEIVVYEWQKVTRCMVLAATTVMGIIIHCTTSIDTRAILWVYGKGIATLGEIVFLYLWYPLGRLVDDFTFHYGVPPTQLRILSIRLVPVYYTFKVYTIFNSVWQVMKTQPAHDDSKHYIWSWSLMLMPIALGMLYNFYKYVVRNKATWTYMLRPVPKWGPRDFSVRQLRKQFDSRYFIGSEVPRLLSRYLLSKRETKVYKVDVRYDMIPRKSVGTKAVGFGMNPEERKKVKLS